MGNIWPNSHTSDAPRDVALLIYLFSQHVPVDIPTLILHALKGVVLNPAKTSRIWFPHLVSELLLGAGVQEEPNDLHMDPLDYFDYDQIEQRVGGIRQHNPPSPPEDDGPIDDEDSAHDDQLAANALPAPEPDGQPSAADGPSFAAPPSDAILARLAEMEERMNTRFAEMGEQMHNRCAAFEARVDTRLGSIEDSIRALVDRSRDKAPRDP